MLFIVMFESTTSLRRSDNKNKIKNNNVAAALDNKIYNDKIIALTLFIASTFFLGSYNYLSNMVDYLNSFIVITGVFGGIAMCLFIGRVLDNKFIIVPWGIISSLYFYALVRAFYPFIMTDKFDLGSKVVEEITLWLIVAAFLLKIVLFVTISWLADTRRLIYLIVEECSLHYKREKDYENFVKYVAIDSKIK
jgi:hypothetical protein